MVRISEGMKQVIVGVFLTGVIASIGASYTANTSREIAAEEYANVIEQERFKLVSLQIKELGIKMDKYQDSSDNLHIELTKSATRNETMLLAAMKRLEKTTNIAESNEKILIAMK